MLASLNIICSIIRGSESVLPVWTETPLEVIKSSVEWNVSLVPVYGMNEYVTMPDGSNVRHYLAEIMSQVQRTMLENAEDNTKSFFVLIRVRMYMYIFARIHIYTHINHLIKCFIFTSRISISLHIQHTHITEMWMYMCVLYIFFVQYVSVIRFIEFY